MPSLVQLQVPAGRHHVKVVEHLTSAREYGAGQRHASTQAGWMLQRGVATMRHEMVRGLIGVRVRVADVEACDELEKGVYGAAQPLGDRDGILHRSGCEAAHNPVELRGEVIRRTQQESVVRATVRLEPRGVVAFEPADEKHTAAVEDRRPGDRIRAAGVLDQDQVGESPGEALHR